ncbi:Vacuolar protein sorting-associated protein [Lachnellula hyalina]|uniref:Vacuolar protein sorting-associated protein n=1 Tax=Lachnellula hyalina TaxID=1316788 RepID=A0A8H8U2X9_9HELO|nr:Vacuolar protein sorting-associated protein [Lachnellula hyalina]TVY29468.1 Vacuolar protein sorting-associated protein [Lachnellula hyalina]
MWLSGRSTPAATPSGSPPPPANRSYSPAPRRPSYLAPPSAAQRPPFNPRSSSLSLISNDSTTSLLSSSRRPNGSGLKQSATAVNAPDPLQVLERLLGSEGKKKVSSKATNGTSTNNNLGDYDYEAELDFDGLSLREIVESQSSNAKEEHVYTSQTTEEFENDKDKFEDLHKSIRACDDVLNSVEINLTSFQNDLAAVSTEIETLQARSTALSVRLENRKVVENGLGPFVEEISVSPAVVRKIVDGSIDEAWVRALAEVEKRSKAMDSKSKEHKNVKGVSDLKPLLENLINKALERIRDFLVQQIKALRSPNINAQIIQQQHFIRYKDLYGFLHKHHPQLAEEIGQAYMNTMRWYFLNQFTRYQKALEKVKLHILDKHDVLGQDDGTRKTTILSAPKITGPPHDAFNLGRRIDLLKTSNQTALSSFLAEEDKTTHYLEFPFRNFNLALVDNASAEYSFLTTFFSPALSYSTISKHFKFIFQPTFALGQTLTKSLVNESYDCLGLLLCVRLNQHFAFELQRRKIPAVDGYINGTSMLLWPRFQQIMDQHCDSVRSVTNSISSRKPSASEQAKQSAAPHFTTQRFAQFIQGILTLSAEAGDDEPVSASLIRLRSEIEAFLTKTSKNIGDSRKRERFLYNNYSLILTIIGDLEGKLALDQQEHFEELKRAFGEGA